MKWSEIMNKTFIKERLLYKIFREPGRIVFGFPVVIKVVSEKSYFPEMKRKKYLTRLLENIAWLIKYREANNFYNIYGLDVKKHESKNYLDYLTFMKDRKHTNIHDIENTQIVLLRDKYLFYKYLSSDNILLPTVFGFIDGNRIYNEYFQIQNSEFLKTKEDYFIKIIDGECASFVKHIRNYNDFKSLQLSKNSKYILQEKVMQHKALSKLNPNSINTLRIVTINKDGKIYVLTSLLRVGTAKTGDVDNWAKGGLAVGITNKGKLKKYGFFKPQYGTKVIKHPDTNEKFENYQIPFFEEAKELVMEAHKYFYNIRSIGWDIAITPDGPAIIEGNDNWEISLQQVTDGGLKQEWKESVSRN